MYNELSLVTQITVDLEQAPINPIVFGAPIITDGDYMTKISRNMLQLLTELEFHLDTRDLKELGCDETEMQGYLDMYAVLFAKPSVFDSLDQKN